MAKNVVKKKVSAKKVSTKKSPSKKVTTRSSKVALKTSPRMSSSEVKKSAPKKVQSKSSRAVLKAPSRSRSLETRQSPVERIRVAWNSLVFFAVFFLISVVCWSVTDIAVYKDLFFLLSLVFGAVCVSLILAMLVYFFYSRIKISRS